MRNTGGHDAPSAKTASQQTTQEAEGAGDTYGGLVDVLPDVRDELGAVAAC